MTYFPPEVEAELIALSEQGDPRAIAIKKLIEQVITLRREMENAKSSSEDIAVRNWVRTFSRVRAYYRVIHDMPDVINVPTVTPSSHRIILGPIRTGQVYDVPEKREGQNIPQELQAPKEEKSHQKNTGEENFLEEDIPYQATQLACASAFLLCTAALTAWFTLGVQLISPLVSIIGMLGSATVYAMSWSAKRELERENIGEKE